MLHGYDFPNTRAFKIFTNRVYQVSDASSSPSAVLIVAARETLETSKVTKPYLRPREVRPRLGRNKPQRLGNALLDRFRRSYK